MGGAAWVVYRVLARLLSAVPEGGTEAVLSRMGNAVATLAAIGVAMVVYLVLWWPWRPSHGRTCP